MTEEWINLKSFGLQVDDLKISTSNNKINFDFLPRHYGGPTEAKLEKFTVSILTLEVNNLDNLVEWTQSLTCLRTLQFEVQSPVAFHCEAMIE